MQTTKPYDYKNVRIDKDEKRCKDQTYFLKILKKQNDLDGRRYANTL